ncbi:hypothetical protein FXO38_27424 [Capsicum annuum]|nr:hypothetical protein FXO38_27424 [Capsicum annuum]
MESPQKMYANLHIRVTSSINTHLDTSLDEIMSHITSLESKCDSIVELIQELHKPCDGQGVGSVNFKGVNEMQEQNVPILEDEIKFETSFYICAKLQSGKIELSTPSDDLLSRKRKWCEVRVIGHLPNHYRLTQCQVLPIGHNRLSLASRDSTVSILKAKAKVNDVHVHHARRGKGRSPGSGRGRGRDDQERNAVLGVNNSSNKKRKDEKHEAITCFLCGEKGHYSRDCRALKHLVDLYQASLKKKERNPEVNFLSENNVDITCLNVADFFEHPEGKIDHLIGDGSVNMKE